MRIMAVGWKSLVVTFASFVLIFAACQKDEMEDRSGVQAAFRAQAGKVPAIPPVFNGVDFGQTPEQAKKALPGLRRFESDSILQWDNYEGGPGPRPFERMRVLLSSGKPIRVERLSVTITNLNDTKILDEQWGEPMVVGNERLLERVWFNAKNGVRARLEGHDLVFERYVPFRDLLGKGPEFAFEKGPILGRSPGEILEHYPQAFAGQRRPGEGESGNANYVDFALPPTELARFSTVIKVPIVKERAAAFWFEIGTQKSEEHKGRIIDYLEKQFALVPSRVSIEKNYQVTDKERPTLLQDGRVWEAEKPGRFVVVTEAEDSVTVFVLPQRTDRIALDVFFEKLP